MGNENIIYPQMMQINADFSFFFAFNTSFAMRYLQLEKNTMSDKVDLRLQHLELALNYFIGLLEEGSLVPRYHEDTRKEIADALYHLLQKVDGLPDDVPDNLVQASAVRAIVEAAESYNKVEMVERKEQLALHMREEEAAASIHGHVLTEWEIVSGSDMEYQASCINCGSFVYVSHSSKYNLLLDLCERI